jgi:hypothetical protein
MSTRSHYDDWTPSGPTSERPGREMSVAPATSLQLGARRERRSLVLVPSASRDVLDSSDHLQPVDGSQPALANACRREHPRVAGSFDGRRVGVLEIPVQLSDLSRGGCFINSLHEQQAGIALVLKIDLPYEGWITVKAETLSRRNEFGFAVRLRLSVLSGRCGRSSNVRPTTPEPSYLFPTYAHANTE